jgi:hypothetical protein
MVLEDSLQIIVRWDDNASATMESTNFRVEPLSTCLSSSRQNKKYIVSPSRHHPELQCQHGWRGQGGPKHQPLADPNWQQKVVLLHCDMAPGHYNSVGAALEIWRNSVCPELQERAGVCYSQVCLRVSQDGPLWMQGEHTWR